MTIFLWVVNNSFLVYNKRRVCIIIIIIIRTERPLNADIITCTYSIVHQLLIGLEKRYFSISKILKTYFSQTHIS